jgi:hypothetical protein
MKRQFPFTTLFLAGWLLATNSNAATNAPDPAEKLGFFVGEWTVKGSEATYSEKCEWLSSKHSFVVCKAEDTDPKDRSTSISIFGYSPEDQTYTYAGFDSSGSSRNLRGWFNGKFWVFTGQRERGTTSPRWQITITPTGAGFHFREDISKNGAEWATSVEMDYLRAQ